MMAIARVVLSVSNGDLKMYFLRIDFIYKGSPVQRTRDLVDNFKEVSRIISTMVREGYHVLSVKVERCS